MFVCQSWCGISLLVIFRNRDTRLAYDNWLREQRLRENQHRVDQTVYFVQKGDQQEIEEFCRCGATFEVSVEELDRILDYALFECENCSLCLKASLVSFCDLTVEWMLFRSFVMNTNSNKVLLLGDTGVGKSTLVNTLCGTPDQRPESTVGVTIKVGYFQQFSTDRQYWFEV